MAVEQPEPFPSFHPVDGAPGVQAVLKCDGTWPQDQFPNCSCVPAVRDTQSYDRMTSAPSETPSCRLQREHEHEQTRAQQAAQVEGPWLRPAQQEANLTFDKLEFDKRNLPEQIQLMYTDDWMLRQLEAASYGAFAVLLHANSRFVVVSCELCN